MYSDLPELKFLYKYFIKVKLDNVIHITNFRIISFTNIIVSCKSLHCKQFFLHNTNNNQNVCINLLFIVIKFSYSNDMVK